MKLNLIISIFMNSNYTKNKSDKDNYNTIKSNISNKVSNKKFGIKNNYLLIQIALVAKVLVTKLMAR